MQWSMKGDAASTRRTPRRPPTLARDGFLRFFHRVENRAGALQEAFALLCQLQTARGAPHERGVELLFEARERAAHAGNRLPEFLGGRRDRAAVDHADEHQQLVRGSFHY